MLRGDTGQLTTTRDVVGSQHGRLQLALSWIESGVDSRQDEADEVPRRGYGTELIQEALVDALRAKVDDTLGQNSVRCRIEMPIS